MRFSAISFLLALASLPVLAHAQQVQTPPRPEPERIVGSITAIQGQSITIKPDTGESVTVTVGDGARILETQPGAKSLAGATTIQLSDIAVGDRILTIARIAPDGSGMLATTLIAMKEAAITQHQQSVQADWLRRGVGGLVKAVDGSAGIITIASGARTLNVHVTPKTIVRRYSPDSIKFADAQPSTLARIQSGDQLRARGDRSADGTDITAEEIVAGTFRNIAGTVVSTDPAANTLTVADLATKKPVVIHVTPESQMHKLPEQMAQFLAMRLKRGDQGQGQSAGQPQDRPVAETAGASPDHSAWRQSGPGTGSGPGQRGGDLSQMLQRTPTVQIADLHKGDAVMIVATQGTPASATAVTLLAGVESLLRASPSASQSMFSASWNLGGGGEGGMGEVGSQ